MRGIETSKRGCCVYGCTNNYTNLREWRKQFCIIHNCNYDTGRCICPPPFFLLAFPTKNEEVKKEWIKRVSRKNWQPNLYTRICSEHFEHFDQEERKPALSFPYPSLEIFKCTVFMWFHIVFRLYNWRNINIYLVVFSL